MKKAFTIIFLLFLLKISFSQTGKPFIKNFYPDDYGAEGQIWCAVQDTNGIMYFGTNSGILQYDGNKFVKTEIPGNKPVRSLGISEKGTVFVGSVGEFGFLKPDKNGLLKYETLISYLDSADRKFTDIWSLQTSGNKVYFASGNFLFTYTDEKNNKTINVNDSIKPFLLYKVNNKIFISSRKKGTGILQKNKIKYLENLKNKAPWFILPAENNKIITGFSRNGLSVFDLNSEKFDNNYFDKKYLKNTNKLLTENKLYTSAVYLGHGRYAVGTIKNGVLITDKNGKTLNIINEDKGITNNTVHFLFKDNQDELWICTAYGISRAEINSPYEILDKYDGAEGSIYDVLRYKNTIYAASNLGLFFFNGKKFEGIKKLSGKDAKQILLTNIFKTKKDSLLLANTVNGIYLIKKDNLPELICNISANSLIQSKYDTSILYFTENYTLYSLKYNGKNFEQAKKISDFKNFIYTGKEINKNELLLISEDKAFLFNIKNKTSKEIRINTNTKINDIIETDGKITALTNDGIYNFNKENMSFEKDSLFLSGINGKIDVFDFVKFKKNSFWLSAKKNGKFFIAEIKKSGNAYEAATFPYKRFGSANNFFSDGDSLLWVTDNKKIIKYKIKNRKDFNRKSKCIIRKIKINNDSVIFSGNGKLPENIISDYKFNNISFEYTLTSYDGDFNEYSYKLENGEEKKWSEPTKSNFKEYTNLFEGSYTFSVKGINAYGVESEPAVFTFKITPPLYRTMPAYFSYLILLSLFIWGLVKLNAERLKKENIKLDNLVKERTAEILTQKEELQTQADYLEEINTELNQKNEEISTIAENLKEANTKINEKNKYIIDSINYAKKIQSAILPSEKEISKYLNDFFVIYKPKDIVSGDFYFFKKRGDYLIFAVADCTGHGVPGGFLAMMGTAVLSDIVQDPSITNPADALEKMRSKIKESLKQHKYIDSRNEGIEIGLCAIDTKNLTLEFAGANHPLYIFRNSELTVLEADLQPAGIHYKEKPFTLKKFKLEKGDMIYMFSDGIFDQFGGPDRKKFLLKNILKLLKKLSSESIKIQKREIINAFNSWKGNNKQVDDVLIFGIRVNDFPTYSE